MYHMGMDTLRRMTFRGIREGRGMMINILLAGAVVIQCMKQKGLMQPDRRLMQCGNQRIYGARIKATHMEYFILKQRDRVAPITIFVLWIQ